MVAMNQQTNDRLWELLALVSEEALTESQFEELNQILSDHADARQLYRDYLAVDDRLKSGEMLFAEIEQEEKPTGLGIGGWRLWATAAALVLGGFLVSESFRGTAVPGSETGEIAIQGSKQPPVEAMASVKSIIGAVWADGQQALEHGEALLDEWIHLEKGVIQLQFQSGAQVSLEGPASLQVVAEGECFVGRGTLVVLAPRRDW